MASAIVTAVAAALAVIYLSGSYATTATSAQAKFDKTPVDCAQLTRSIVTRREWGATRHSGKHLDRFPVQPDHVFIHQTWFSEYDRSTRCDDARSCASYLRNLQDYHRTIRQWPDICYNFVIAQDGTIYEGVGWDKEGWHTLNYANDSIGIAIMGNYEHNIFTRRSEQSLQSLLDCAIQGKYLSPQFKLHGHKDARCTSCPGKAAYERIQLMDHFHAGPLARYSCPARDKREVTQPEVSDLETLDSHREAVKVELAPEVTESTSVYEEEEETIVGLIRHRRQGGVQKTGSRTGATNTAITINQEATAPISKGAEKQIIVINVPAATPTTSGQHSTAQQQQLQPAFYLLTSKNKLAAPTLLLAQAAAAAAASPPTGRATGSGARGADAEPQESGAGRRGGEAAAGGANRGAGEGASTGRGVARGGLGAGAGEGGRGGASGQQLAGAGSQEGSNEGGRGGGRQRESGGGGGENAAGNMEAESIMASAQVQLPASTGGVSIWQSSELLAASLIGKLEGLLSFV